jgi:hypothetical protein
MDSNHSRLRDQITKLFDDFHRKTPPKDREQAKALADLRQAIYASISVFLGEADIARRYGVAVDGFSLVSFDEYTVPKWPPTWEGVDPRNSWIPIPSEGGTLRPAGITNEEYSDCLAKLQKEFGKFLERDWRQRLQQPKLISNENYQALLSATLSLFRDAFLKPATDVPFRAGTYVRITVRSGRTVPLLFGEDLARQNVPCQICGENRVTDLCHIVPKVLGGSRKIDNVLLLCPTHHALVDRGMLTREEWDRIDWSVKNTKSQQYALKVLLPVHQKFWAKLEAGDCEKKHEGSPKGEMRTLYDQCRDEIGNEKDD